MSHKLTDKNVRERVDMYRELIGYKNDKHNGYERFQLSVIQSQLRSQLKFFLKQHPNVPGVNYDV